MRLTKEKKTLIAKEKQKREDETEEKEEKENRGRKKKEMEQNKKESGKRRALLNASNQPSNQRQWAKTAEKHGERRVKKR